MVNETAMLIVQLNRLLRIGTNLLKAWICLIKILSLMEYNWDYLSLGLYLHLGLFLTY